MANSPQARKRIRRNNNRAEINGARVSRIRSFVKKVETALAAEDKTAAAAALKDAQPELARGVAKECARVLLPEGLTPTRMYINGNFRSWIHYLKVRTHESNQKEHRTTANLILRMMHEVAPITTRAFFGEPDTSIKVGGIQ